MLINSCLCQYDRIKDLYSFHASHKYNLFVFEMYNDISSYLKYISFKYFQILNLSQLRKANVSMSLNMNLNLYSEYEFECT